MMALEVIIRPKRGPGVLVCLQGPLIQRNLPEVCASGSGAVEAWTPSVNRRTQDTPKAIQEL